MEHSGGARFLTYVNAVVGVDQLSLGVVSEHPKIIANPCTTLYGELLDDHFSARR